MLYITKSGHVDAERIKIMIFSTIERGTLERVNGIVVHQTGGPTAESAFNSYRNTGANGAHFLIDKDGSIYQTASLYKVTNHVGKAKSRCVVTKKCDSTEFKRMNALEKAWKPAEISKTEYEKRFPDRFPVNSDAIRIEIVGKANRIPGQRDEVYEPVTEQQNASLK